MYISLMNVVLGEMDKIFFVSYYTVKPTSCLHISSINLWTWPSPFTKSLYANGYGFVLNVHIDESVESCFYLQTTNNLSKTVATSDTWLLAFLLLGYVTTFADKLYVMFTSYSQCKCISVIFSCNMAGLLISVYLVVDVILIRMLISDFSQYWVTVYQNREKTDPDSPPICDTEVPVLTASLLVTYY